MKGFHFQYVFCLHPAVHLDKQIAIPCFLNSFRGNTRRNIFYYDKKVEFGLTNLLPRFYNNEYGDVCCLILRVWFWQVSFSLLIWRRYICWIFFVGPALHHPPRNSTCVGNETREKAIHLGWDGDTWPVYSSWE